MRRGRRYRCEAFQKTDFRAAAVDTDVKLVLAALALTTNWLNEHPECAVAAWLSSGVTEEADYRGDPALSQLYDRACMAMKDPSYDQITTEYKRGRGLWSTDTVFLLDQVEDALATAADPAKHADIKTALGDIPWLSEAESESRKRWLAKSLADQEATKKAKHEEAPAAAQEGPEGRKKKTQELVAEAAAKLKAERAAKEEKEEARRHELMRDAAVEYIRKEFRAKSTSLHPRVSWTVWRKLADARARWPRACVRTDAGCIPRKSGHTCNATRIIVPKSRHSSRAASLPWIHNTVWVH